MKKIDIKKLTLVPLSQYHKNIGRLKLGNMKNENLSKFIKTTKKNERSNTL